MVETVGVKYSEIEYPCGCISHMDRMEYCKTHSGEENERFRKALKMIRGDGPLLADMDCIDDSEELIAEYVSAQKIAHETLGGK